MGIRSFLASTLYTYRKFREAKKALRRPPDPDVVYRIREDLSRWRWPASARVELAPLVALTELEAWSVDPGRLAEARGVDWKSLLGDVLSAWRGLGVNTQAAMRRLAVTLQDLESVQGQIRPKQRGINDATSKAIARAAKVLRHEIGRSEVLAGAIQDLLGAAAHDQTLEPLQPDADVRWQLAILHNVARYHGHDWALVADRLSTAIGADPEAVAQPLKEVLTVLNHAPERGHSVVWVAIDHAYFWGLSGLEPTVQFFESDWLLQHLRETPQEHLTERNVPIELTIDPRRLAASFEPRLNEELPVVLARVDLGYGLVAGAHERALDTLELLRAFASFRQGGTNWRIGDDRLHFVDGQLVSRASGPIGDPDVYDRLTRMNILNDPTGITLKANAANLAPHLPVTETRTREALELARWLTVARQTWLPGRLVMSGRILETCANWSNRDVGKLVEDLVLPSAWTKLEGRIERVGRAALYGIPGSNGTSTTEGGRAAFLRLSGEILVEPGAVWPIARPREVVSHLQELLALHPAGSELRPPLDALDWLLRSGHRTHAEIKRLAEEAKQLHQRSRRARNALVHGGPFSIDVVRTVVRSQDDFASLALRWVLDAELAGVPLSQHVDQMENRFRRAYSSLGRGGRPADQLFW